MPLVHVIPVESILGKLSLVQAGDTGTITFEPTASCQGEINALIDQYYPGPDQVVCRILGQEKGMEAGYGSPTRGPWVGLGTCKQRNGPGPELALGPSDFCPMSAT